MKKRIASFSGGFLAALTLSACLTTALAASGKVSYNFANVASELLGTEIGYDSATKTVLLGKQQVSNSGANDPNSSRQSWVADGWKATIERADGTVEEVPSFSDLFPGQELPTG